MLKLEQILNGVNEMTEIDTALRALNSELCRSIDKRILMVRDGQEISSEFKTLNDHIKEIEASIKFLNKLKNEA